MGQVPLIPDDYFKSSHRQFCNNFNSLPPLVVKNHALSTYHVAKKNLGKTLRSKKFVGGPTEYTELQPLLSGLHSVMRVKSVLAGEGGGARPPPLITFTLTSKVAVYAPAEWACRYTDPVSSLLIYVLCG